MTAPIWVTPAGFLGTVTEHITTATSIYASGSNITYKIIHGTVPAGLVLKLNGSISGTPYSVGEVVRSQFVVRASNDSGVTDRTFYLDTNGFIGPVWLTPAGSLPIGSFNKHYTINGEFIDYQLSAEIEKLPAGQKLRYYIEDRNGQLPPGLVLTEDGRIIGQVKDTLKLEYKASNDGGYDIDPYDQYAYDFVNLSQGQAGSSPIYIAKTYQFNITATDGVTNTKRRFNIKIEDPSNLRVDNTNVSIDTTDFTADLNYILSPQWISPANLGVVRASNRQIINLDVYDFNPFYGPVTYSTQTDVGWAPFIEYKIDFSISYQNKTYRCIKSHKSELYFNAANWVLNQLPPNFNLDQNSGVLYAVLPYQPAYSISYRFTVFVYKTDRATQDRSASAKTFMMTVKGDVESTIQFVTDRNVGVISPGYISELFVKADLIGSTAQLEYSLIDGTLPAGLSLATDGTIQGQLEYNSQLTVDSEKFGFDAFVLDGGTTTFDTYHAFTVQVGDIYQQASLQKEFVLETKVTDLTKYTKVYAQPLLQVDQREIYYEFINDSYIFDRSLIYRQHDANFGIQQKVQMVIEHGIQQVRLDDYYTEAMRFFFNKKRFYFGNVVYKSAEDSNGNYVYDIVYVELVDYEQASIDVGRGPVQVGKVTTYPASVNNMRAQLESIKLEGVTVATDEYLMPRFMRTVQADTGSPLGFILAAPLCYAVPGAGKTIVNRIKLSDFNFTSIDFEVDRLLVKNTLDHSTDKYLMFTQKDASGTNLGESRSYINDPEDTVWFTEDGEHLYLE